MMEEITVVAQAAIRDIRIAFITTAAPTQITLTG
jgi:hypothetical protein